jgi:selenocysteine lyase/cysteine desulfurase
MEKKFERFRKNTIGHNIKYKSPYGTQRMIYADWVASGRLYRPIEETIANSIGPYVANTHTETSETGTLMTNAYHTAHSKIKEHCNADRNDVIITAGFGMTTVVNKLQRLLGMKCYLKKNIKKYIPESEKPVVFITHMEHHSNHTSWYETEADVVVIPHGDDLLCDLNRFEDELKKYKNRKIKFGSFSACSNVTGIQPPYHEMAKLMHKYNGYCFVDFAASAPYVDIDMHPKNKAEKLDAVFFSPHKFLGGPGSSGVMIFDSELYQNYIPDQPGGGTVEWTNPWGEYKYIDDIEIREDGGTPGFIQAIRTALSIEVKNQMGVENMEKREKQLVKIAFKELRKVPGLHVLADNTENRLGIFSFYIDNIHYNLVVRLLSDRFGIQVRGGCACAGTYGHYLLNVDYKHSKKIANLINHGDLSLKPGWVRLSLHPTMTNEDLYIVADALKQIQKNNVKWSADYKYDNRSNEFYHKSGRHNAVDISKWFTLK